MIKIDIWSDINCPFCYIGKRHLEQALKNFTKDDVSIEWRSFELDPLANPPKGANQAELLAKKYGRDLNWAREMNNNMTEMAKNSGLDFHLEKMIPANSFDAHRLIHLAKENNKQDEMKERLLKANFVDGMDISDKKVLKELASAVGLNAVEVESVLESTRFAEEVRQDEQMASKLGISGVPFFVFNQSLALSGAQPPEAFAEALSKSVQA